MEAAPRPRRRAARAPGELPPGDNELEGPELYAANLREAAGLERQRGAIAFVRARRPLYVVLAIVAAALAGLAIAAIAWVYSYQPIVYGNQGQLPLDSKPSSGRAGVTVIFHRGRPFLYGITIQNTRRFAVRIRGAPMPDYCRCRLYTSRTSVNDNELPHVPFHPFDLQPGQERWLVWKGVYSCMGARNIPFGEGTTWMDVPVRYSFLWRRATTDLTLKDPLTIVFKRDRCQ